MAVKEYRSNVFSMLLEEKKYALEVYNALNESNYTDIELVTIQRLENGITISVRNDASFFINGQLNIYEHQSKYNPNMALRELIYYVDIIKPIVKDSDIYGKNPVKIPMPHFCVFYNGQEKRPKEEMFFLSELYEKATDEPELEVRCKMININRDVNPEFLGRCKVLDEYTYFIDTVNQNRRGGMTYKESIEEAIKKCISEDVLKEFLKARGNEVLEVMTLDYTWERREELIRRDEREEGRTIGIEEGRTIGIEEGRTIGIEEGRTEERIVLICKKIKKGKSVDEIADALEEDTAIIQKYVDIIQKYAPEYDVKKIMEEMK